MELEALSSNEEDTIITWFENISENAGQVQTETLRSILELNRGVEYLNKLINDVQVQEMMSSSDLEALYSKLVPLVSHADLEPYIMRIADGEKIPLLSQQPITTFSLSSGTTDGRQKLVPFTQHSAYTTLQTFRLAAAYRSRVYPVTEGGKILEFIYSSKQYKTKGGLTVGTATTHYYASEEFKTKQTETNLFTCSPREVICGGDYNQSTYCHLLLGIFFSEQVKFVTSTFAYSIVQAFTSFEELWKEICNDIERGKVSPTRVSQLTMRKAVNDILTPNPDLATSLASKCEELEKLEWNGLIPVLWPNAKYVYSIMTGSMEHYLKKLRHYGGGLMPLVSADYGSTESWIGVNLDPSLLPEEVSFAVVPSFSYYEFIPLRRENHDCDSNGLVVDDFLEDEPVPLSRVKVGQVYEIVLTTFTGLYRCRLGDVVEVVGFHNKTPKLNFVCRRKLLLTINIDKNTEKDLQIVVEKGSQLLTKKSKAELVDFTSHADISNHPGHYIIYWEIKGQVEERVIEECCEEMDASFVDHGYVVSRRTNSIGPLELCIVERGTFKRILEHFIGNGAALSQFKTPRCTRNQVLLTILNCYTIKRVHSSAYR